MADFARLVVNTSSHSPAVSFPLRKTRVHRSRPEERRTAPTFFFPLMMLLLTVAVALVCWDAYNALPQKKVDGEKHLRLFTISPKFNPTSAKAPQAALPELCPDLEFDEPAVAIKATAEPPLELMPPAVALVAPRPLATEAPQIPPALALAEPPVALPPVDLPLVQAPPPVPTPPAPVAPPPPAPVALPPVPVPLPPAPVAAAPTSVPLPMFPPLLPPVAIQPAKLLPAEPPTVQVANTTPLVYRESTSGDTPMLRNWKTLALYSLLTTTVFVQVPAPVAAGDKDNKALLDRLDSLEKTIKKSADDRLDLDKTVKKSFDDRLEALDKTIKKSFEDRIDTLKETIKKSFDDVATDMGTIKTDLASQKGDLKKIRDDIDVVKDDSLKQRLQVADAHAKIKQMEGALEKIRIDLDLLRTREPSPGKPALDKASVDEIKLKLGGIEQAILKLLPLTTNRIAMSPPSLTGRVVLVNLYQEELLFVVNQKPYRVAPGANLPVENVPAGVVNYEVISGTWGLRARTTTNLAANETFTLTAR